MPAWYTEESSFVVERRRRAGAAVVDEKQVIWASSLPEGTSAQETDPPRGYTYARESGYYPLSEPLKGTGA